MSLKIAVQMDPIERINIRGDSTFALLLEAQSRGHAISYYTPDRLALSGNTRDRGGAAAQPCATRRATTSRSARRSGPSSAPST